MSSQAPTTISRQPRRPRTRVESSGSETSLPDLDLTITVHNNSPASEQPAVAAAQPDRQVATLAPPPPMPVLVISDSENEEDVNNRRRRRRVEVPLLRLPTTPSQTAAATTEAADAAGDDDDDDEDMYEAVDSSILPENERNIFLEIEKKAEDYYCGICFGLCKEPVTLPCRHMFCAGHLPALYQTTKKCPSCRHSISMWLQFAIKNPRESIIPSVNASLRVLKQKRRLYVKRIKLLKALKANSEELNFL